MNKKSKKIPIAWKITFLLIAQLFFCCTSRRKYTKAAEIYPQRGSIAIEFRETGIVKPRNRLEIKPQLNGRLEEILVVEGQKVKKGEILAWMSSTDRAALLDVAQSKGPEEYKKWQDAYKPTPIISPIDGFVIARNKEPGQSVTTADVVLVIADELIVMAQVDETDLRYIKLGQKVKLFLDAYPQYKFPGVVEHIAYESDVVNNVVIYQVRIRPLEHLAYLRSGMTATVEITAQRKDNVLLVPIESIIERGNKKLVLVKQKNSHPRLQEVVTGISNGKQTEVISGITEDDILFRPTPLQRSNSRQGQSGWRYGGLPGIGRR